MAVKTVKKTINVAYTNAPVISCKARESFTHDGQQVNKGETFFLVRSGSQPGEYHW